MRPTLKGDREQIRRAGDLRLASGCYSFLRGKPGSELRDDSLANLRGDAVEKLDLQLRPATLTVASRPTRTNGVNAQNCNFAALIGKSECLALLSKGEIRLQSTANVGQIDASTRELRGDLSRKFFVCDWCAFNLGPFTQGARRARGSFSFEGVAHRLAVRSATS